MQSEKEEGGKVDIESLIEGAKHVGNVFAWRIYGIDRIYITLKKGIKLPVGSYVFVKDDDGLPIVYQVASPSYYRYSYDFEKRLIAHGGISRDESHTYDCVGILVGKVMEDGKVQPPRYPIPPFTEVYECTDKLMEFLTTPSRDPVLEIGNEPLTEQKIRISLWALIRQGLLISGAQGTGKTTGLLTLICRALLAYRNLRFLILDWTGEMTVLKSLAEKGHPDDSSFKPSVKILPWDGLMKALSYSNPELLVRLIKEDDPRVRGAVKEVLTQALIICNKEGKFPTKSNLLEIVGDVEEVKGKPKVVSGRFQTRRASTIEAVRDVIELSERIPEEKPEDVLTLEDVVNDIRSTNIVMIDFSRTADPDIPDDFELKKSVAETIAGYIWEVARIDRKFGCVVVSDEAHRICPERGYGEKISSVWLRLATEGGRNGCPLWLVARRLSLVSKSVTTELQQNFFCFNVEDVDRARVAEDLGESFASLLGGLPPGEAIVKSAAGFKIPGQVVHVHFDEVLKPASAEYGLEQRFPKLSSI